MGFDDNINPDDLRPLNPYGVSKVEADRWINKQTKTPPYWYGLRFFNVFGPNEYHKKDMSSVVYKSFLQIRETGKVRLFRSYHPSYRDGEQLRDFVYVKEITQWITELMQFKPTSGIYNMGFGQARSWLDLVTCVFQTMQKPINIDWIPIPENIRNQYQYFTEARLEKLLLQKVHKPHWTLEMAVHDYVSNYLLKDKAQLS